MTQCGSLINLACIQNEACLLRFEYMTWQFFAKNILCTKTSYCKRCDAVELKGCNFL